MRAIRGAVLGMAVSASMFASAAWAAPVKWDLSTEYAPASLPGRVNAYFADKVKELSKGEFDITIHYGGALGFKAADHYTAVEDGALMIASTPFNRMNGIYPIFELQSLPFLQTTLDEAENLDSALRPLYNHAMQANGQFLLFTMPWTPQGFWAKKPIVSKADLEGFRVRVVDLAAVQTMKKAGADAIQLSWADTLPAISTGAINGVLTSDDGGLSAKFPEAGLTAFTPVGFTVGVEMVHVNQKAFDDLPPEMQTVLLVAAGEAEKYGWALSRKTVADNLQKMKELGVTVGEITPEFKAYLKESAAPAIDAWKKRFGPQADMVFDFATAAMKAN
ncbi:TRAP transporter substrate-binding protein [Ancylobacter mangrovi]|uniref:TRAP transporter substrate-binding protein n=1 Tax=Ancylobacter mangrovi TaxID=2972472 RepID=A0A9X2P9M7_9HYPH|nr:TRAP transporter substrate-binding protein [Ancylobacter mangrovi]MCS0494609.1 TRAP transporter substrate-binding protein [Ancylobacter mangrovi]MCS0502010.1 TRAP transporter substrate-binding protein [Ancylobacter mangrovi]